MTGAGADVLLVDDHPLLQWGLQGGLVQLGVDAHIGTVASLDQLMEQIDGLRPRLVVLDHGLPSLGDGLRLIPLISARGCRVMMLTATQDEQMWGACLEAGAVAVVSKTEDLQDITDSVLSALAGRPVREASRARLLRLLHDQRRAHGEQLGPFDALSARESVVLAALMKGRAPAEIAGDEFVSVETIRTQVKSVLRKLGAKSQVEAVAMAYQAGWLGSESAELGTGNEPEHRAMPGV